MSSKYTKFKKKTVPVGDRYPRSSHNRYRRRYSRSAKIRRAKQTIAAICGFLVLIGVGFFMASTLIDISEKPVPTTALSAPQNDKSPDKNVTEAPAPVKQAPKTAAIYLPEKIIRNPNSLNAFLENAKKIGATAVVIDFKRDDGTLAYQSESANAKKINSVQNAADLKQIIKTIQDSGIKVTARIHCFRDPLAASRLGASAYVHYKDTASAWIDNAPDKGGKRWLNPFSEESQNYLLEIIAEVSAMNVDEIILQSVQFPSGYGLSSATYPGESESGKTKNQILKIFISKASRSAGAVPLAVEVTADGTLNGSDSLYGGSLIDSKDAVFSPDFRISTLPNSVKIGEEVIQNPKADPVNFITKSAQLLKNNASNLVPVLEPSPNLSEQIKALNDAGINGYIVYSENGNYTKIK